VIVSRDRIRRAVAVAMHLDPKRDAEAAIAAVAQSLGLDVEAVHDAVQPEQSELAA
jgi:hypothetical protein